MALALELQRVVSSRRNIKWVYKVTPSSNYATDGDTLDFTAATGNPSIGHPLPNHIPTDGEVTVLGVKGGYTADFVAGTTMANSKMIFYSAADTQLTNAAAYPAGVSAAYIAVEQSRA